MDTTTPAPAPTTQFIFTPAFGAIGGIGTVMWAAKTKRKGKFWWFLGGFFLGGWAGFFVDYAMMPKTTQPPAIPSTAPAAPSPNPAPPGIYTGPTTTALV